MLSYAKNLVLLLLIAGLMPAGGCASSYQGRRTSDAPMVAPKQPKALGMPWETEFGYAQGVQAGSLIHVAGQMSLDNTGAIVGAGNIEAQMRQAYANVKKVLELFHATTEDVLEETIYVTDMQAALPVASKVRRDVYSVHPAVASTILQVQQLAFKEALVEIRVTAKTQQVMPDRSYEEQPKRDSNQDPSQRGSGRRGGGSRGGGGGFP